jgi:hypothetical protein
MPDVDAVATPGSEDATGRDLRAQALELLRPPAHRGPLIASGAVVVTLGIALEELRLSDKLGNGVHLAILVLSAAVMLGLGVQFRPEGGRPPAFQSVLLVCGLGLLYAALLTLANVLGADFDRFSPGAFVWTSLIVGAVATWAALERASAICALIAAVAFAIAVLSFWDWLFHPSGQAAFRWLLALMALALVLFSLVARGGWPRHAEQLVNAAAIAVLAIGLSGVAGAVVAAISPFGAAPSSPLPGFWELVLVAAGCGLIAYGAIDRAPGAAWLGLANLLTFTVAVTAGADETLAWWPLLLLMLGVGTMAAGLRPRAPLPPEPPGYSARDTPLAARSAERLGGESLWDDTTVVRVRDDGPTR